jgi:hypothetical protein
MASESQGQSVTCTGCGEEIEEDEATYGSGSVQEDGTERLAKGEVVGLDEVFAFDEPYCSLDCLLAGDGDE